MDDIFVYGRSQEEHDQHLNAVLQKLQESGLMVRFDIEV